jgi:CRISPR-associated protein Cpf1
LEDLNFDFKNKRIGVERQVYNDFEKGLLKKLNYYVEKK